MSESFLNGKVELHCGDLAAVLPTLAENSIDSCVSDPPYHLTSIVKRFGAANAAPARAGKTGAYARASAGFMGRTWDGGDIAFRIETWAEVYRVLKPGAHLVAFSGTRTYHRLACAIEDAGFEIRDQIGWLYGSGFPKSLDVSKAIDKAAGVEREIVGANPNHRAISGVDYEGVYAGGNTGASTITTPATEAAQQWEGWGTALKPAQEPIVVARKPLSEPTVAANVLKWGTGAINIDDCRIRTNDDLNGGAYAENGTYRDDGWGMQRGEAGAYVQPTGRWPANIIHDGSEEVLAGFPECKPGGNKPEASARKRNNGIGLGSGDKRLGRSGAPDQYKDSGSAARFFYSAKANKTDRAGSKHPTVKPVDLMAYLCRLITPPGGVVLDPFAGSGTTAVAALAEGFRAVLIERESEYQDDIRRRMALALSGPDERARESIKAKLKDKPIDAGPLFAV